MSEISVNSINDASGGATTTINGFTPTVSNMAGRNKIINGGMVIDQRNAGAAVALASGAVYSIDRWAGACAGGVAISSQRSTVAPAGFTNSLLTTITTAKTPAASDYASQLYRIEGFTVADLGWGTPSAQSVTLSFNVRSSVTGTFGVAFRNAAAARSYVASFTISEADTYESKSVTIAGDTSGTWLIDNGLGITVSFDLGVGATYSGAAGAWSTNNFFGLTDGTKLSATSGATFYITGVQLEAGSVATPFEHRMYGQELALCQRYCQKFGGTGVYDHIGDGFASATTQGNIQVPLKVTMRAAPSVTSSTLIVTDVQATTSSVSSLQIVSGQTNENIGYVTATTTGMTQYRPCFLLTNNSTNGYVIFAAEL